MWLTDQQTASLKLVLILKRDIQVFDENVSCPLTDITLLRFTHKLLRECFVSSAIGHPKMSRLSWEEVISPPSGVGQKRQNKSYLWCTRTRLVVCWKDLIALTIVWITLHIEEWSSSTQGSKVKSESAWVRIVSSFISVNLQSHKDTENIQFHKNSLMYFTSILHGCRGFLRTLLHR